MSVTLERQYVWQTRPGWGIAVDLTPGEVVNARRIGVLKKGIVAGLVLVLALCAVATYLTLDDEWAARDANNAEQARTAEMQREIQQYSDITLMENTITQTRTQIATLMKDDVDYVNLMAKVRARAPEGVTITNLSILLAALNGAPPAPGAVGPVVIGTATISGRSSSISALAPYVKSLSMLRGVDEVVPTSNTKTELGVEYTLSMDITDELLTHRFENTGGAE
jgi:Tfp pilus assembly protein PilN